MTRKRKRGPGVGHYTDSDTGEIRTVETSRHVKQKHKQSGTWYKQPTDKELRQWDRQDTLHDRATKIRQREEHRRISTEKKIQKLVKEREAVEQQYSEGKITFTQTLAKKDEDQLNLHKWFGGRPKCQSRSDSAGETQHDSETSCDNRSVNSCTTSSSPCPTQALALPEQDLVAFFSDDEDADLSIHNGDTRATTVSKKNACNEQISVKMHTSRPRLTCQGDLQKPNGEQEAPQPSERPKSGLQTDFKIPELPKHKRRSPLSEATNEVTPRISRQNQANSSNPVLNLKPAAILDANVIEDLFTGICTQDLYEFENVDKENGPPTCLIQRQILHDEPEDDPTISKFTIRSETAAIAPISKHNRGVVEDSAKESEPDYDDDELDDQTLLLAFSSPFQSLKGISSTNTNYDQPSNPDCGCNTAHFQTDLDTSFAGTSFTDSDFLSMAVEVETRKQFRKYESFAMDSIEDDDLIEGLAYFEELEASKEQKPITVRKRRVLPWNLPAQEGLVHTAHAEQFPSPTQETLSNNF